MTEPRLSSPYHNRIRGILRIAGPVVGVAGLILMLIGLVSFFRSFGAFEPPRYFWCVFAGMPLLFAGLVMTKAGYLGAIYRYFAAEATPVATDAFNDVAEGAQPGLRAAAKSITEGIVEGKRTQEPPN